MKLGTNIYITLILVIFSRNLGAQVLSDVFDDRQIVTEEKSGNLELGIHNLNFTRNNEYFTDIADGYTLFGYQLLPRLIYYPNEYLRVEGGIFLLKEFGFPNFYHVAPIFSLKFKKKAISLLFGNIESAHNHRFIEPLYGFEQVFHKRLEYGSQVLIETNRFWLDGWMSWEKYIDKGDPFQEELVAGLSTRTSLNDPTSPIKLETPIQLMFTHKGGQIDATENFLETFFYAAFGIRGTINIGENSRLISNNYYTIYRDLSNTKLRSYNKGNGWLFDLLLETKHLSIGSTYWKGYKFQADRGNALFQSVSQIDLKYNEPNRELILIRLIHESKMAPNFYMSTRFEPYYDFGFSLLEYSYGIYATYKQDILLKKVQTSE